MKKKVAITVDVEGAWISHPQEQCDFDPEPVLKAVRFLEQELAKVESSFLTRIPVTWFVRCDDSVSHAMGNPEGLLLAMDGFVNSRLDAGDKFGLHVHFYAQDQHRVWGTELRPGKQREILERAIEAWSRYFRSNPALSRMGEGFMTGEIAAAIDAAEIKIDATALPGRVRLDSGFHIDWQGTPEHPYLPSKQDHRKAASKQSDAYGFTEAPFSMLSVNAPYDSVPLARYFNLAFRTDSLKGGLRKFKSAAGGIIATLHPHEVAMGEERHPLIEKSEGAVLLNLQNLAAEVGDIEFVTIDEIARISDG